jgi:hypothetical protein
MAFCKSKREESGSHTALGFSLLGKYPIEMGPITLFPLLGITYNMVLTSKMKNKYNDRLEEIDEKTGPNFYHQSQFGLLAGGGLDFPLTDTLYLRGEALFGLYFANKVLRDMRYEENEDPFTKAKTTPGFGPRIKLAAGYRF